MKRFFEIISEYAELPKEGRLILPKRQTKNSAGYDFYAREVVCMPRKPLGFDEHICGLCGRKFHPPYQGSYLWRRTHHGHQLWFCSEGCMNTWEKEKRKKP